MSPSPQMRPVRMVCRRQMEEGWYVCIAPLRGQHCLSEEDILRQNTSKQTDIFVISARLTVGLNMPSLVIRRGIGELDNLKLTVGVIKLLRLSTQNQIELKSLIFFSEAETRQLNSCIEKYPEGGPRAHICKICLKVSNDRSNLRKHVENIHYPGTFVHDCKYCGESFTTRNMLYLHGNKCSFKNQ